MLELLIISIFYNTPVIHIQQEESKTCVVEKDTEQPRFANDKFSNKKKEKTTIRCY